jgi:hypothetical protein
MCLDMKYFKKKNRKVKKQKKIEYKKGCASKFVGTKKNINDNLGEDGKSLNNLFYYKLFSLYVSIFL